MVCREEPLGTREERITDPDTEIPRREEEELDFSKRRQESGKKNGDEQPEQSSENPNIAGTCIRPGYKTRYG